MIPDLGRYSVEVLSAYGASLLLLIILVGGSIWKARRVRAKLEQVEMRRGKTS